MCELGGAVLANLWEADPTDVRDSYHCEWCGNAPCLAAATITAAPLLLLSRTMVRLLPATHVRARYIYIGFHNTSAVGAHLLVQAHSICMAAGTGLPLVAWVCQ